VCGNVHQRLEAGTARFGARTFTLLNKIQEVDKGLFLLTPQRVTSGPKLRLKKPLQEGCNNDEI